jgi:23S rRNA (adenine-N6)-dimethyltransferase
VAVRRRPARGAPGQHFLRSSRLASALVREARVSSDDLVVEVGAGTGVLTNALAATGARVLALELDPRLASGLHGRFGKHSKVTVLDIDARRFDWPEEPFRLVANLPFAGSGELLGHLLRDPSVHLTQADVIVQWEVAAKHSAIWPATLRSAYWKAWFELTITARLARSAFAPTPSVDAAVLRFARRVPPLVPLEDHVRYWRFLTNAFSIRGPMCVGSRRPVTPVQLRRLADTLGFSPDAHARDLDARQWATLFTFVSDSPSP